MNHNTVKKISRLLVANRGEIAIRVFRAATELNITTIGIYTYEDRYSLHRYKADEAYQIGSNTDPLKPYLDVEEIIHLAKRVQADAIHPGYGFLSENVQFARRCREEGIVFVGPEPEVMENLGDKVKAKEIAVKAQVPIIESNRQPLTDATVAIQEAARIGYPVMVKAAAGGGGRGMRVVRNNEELQKAFTEARREAKTAFGDDTVFIEKFIENPRHIEVQILGDNYGNIVHLFERDCSVQRRFQKVVEIAPAPSLLDETKSALYGYALRIARTVNYNNAGTVEFLVDAKDNIFFIEVNPRIQVEHTVTEVVTGIDLVRTQILIAEGHALNSQRLRIYGQHDIHLNGFALQCRITTEDPQNGFKPDYGTIVAYRNAAGFNIRLDEGSAFTGAVISPFFDSMLVKVTASGRSFNGACQRLHRALLEFRVRGVKTNLPFLEKVITHPIFLAGNATVGFIDQHPELFEFKRRRDRATKLLGYLANVSVNGNPDVRHVDANRKFTQPPIPGGYNRHSPAYPNGTKQLLTQLKPDGFCHWLKDQTTLQITDTTFRDAHQSLLATRVRTNDMLQVAEAFAKCHPQTFSMEVWGGATFDVAMRFLHECPWQRLKLLRQAIPNILLQMLLRGANAVGYTAYPDNLVFKFVEKAAETGIDIFRIFDSLNWIENMRGSIEAVRKYTGSIAEACICYTGDLTNPNEKKFTLQYYLTLAKQLEDAGAHMIAIKDMAGLLKPYAASVLISELKKNVQVPIHLHTHDTSSAQLATYLKAVEAGVDVVDVALAAMSGLTSQPNFNTLIEILKGQERAPQFNIESLNLFSDYWEAVREYYYPFESGLHAGTAEVYAHEMPGGQYSNLQAQAAAIGLENRMTDIKNAYIAVNRLFGGIVKVTPSSKVVGDLALFMVSNNLTEEEILQKGDTLAFPESVRGFFRGDLGQPYGGFPEKMQQMVLKGVEPITDRANAHMQPVDFEGEFDRFCSQYGDLSSELDFLSYKLYPKVFDDFYRHRQQYGDVGILPTLPFFFGLKEGEEITVDLEPGKTLLIKLLYMSKPDAEGCRNVHFNLNGQTRTVRVKDHSIMVKEVSNQKAQAGNESEIGAPLQGRLSKIFVKPGDKVSKNAPLFVIEAMKMETTVTAPYNATIDRITLPEGVMVKADDLVVKLL
ncbi:pyruvate carboxylase [Sphingobacteriales bacterium UPWRP_1]|nr:pyruvate carboxylase [Sphingobacteriales bacterium TSM_CSS]PSJ72436.1 pyruvate carboxylase [Sphingobacteriales bacterium UPWRP_1]